MSEAVLIAVVAARVIVPLWIPRYPIPALLGALVIDAADQSVFAAFDVEPANYQSYDKSLDVYYLAIAYISTIRNWTDEFPFRVGQFLWYYRLIGVVAFEATGARALLLVFPNTFEYFFLYYEGVRVRYDPSRLTDRHVVIAAATIWIGIKLPQEWWVHVAQLDVTDFVADHPWTVVIVGLLAVAAGYGVARTRHRFPVPDWPAAFDVDTRPTTVVGEPADPPSGPRSLIYHPVTEKTVLISLVTVTFSQILPDTGISAPRLALAVAVVVIVNSFITQRLIRRGPDWSRVTIHFLTMAAVNAGILIAYVYLVRRHPGVLPVPHAAVLLGLLTLIGTLYDRYRYLRLRSVGRRPPDRRGSIGAAHASW